MAASIRKPPVYCLSLSLSPCMVSAWLRHASLTQAACLCTLLVLLAIACIVCMPLYTCICQGFRGSVSELAGIVHASAAKLRLVPSKQLMPLVPTGARTPDKDLVVSSMESSLDLNSDVITR